MLVMQSSLVWAGEKFDYAWYIETGKAVAADWSEFTPMLQQAQTAAMEGKAEWLVEKTSKQARHT
jgi:hypothetical protein